MHPVLAEVERSGFVESRHRGSVSALRADGSAAMRLGSPDAPIFPRSANKPMQAAAMLRQGLDLDGELLALAAASHSGEDFHVEGVLKILAGAGLTAEALRCPPSAPLDDPGPPTRPHMNCSGKHAAMLATCVRSGWPTESYLDPSHPLQLAIRDTVERLTGERVAVTGVDGCGAPLFAVTLSGVARAFRAVVLAAPGTPERRVADAMRAHPEWTSGTRREERRFMDAVPGLLVKGGAEGVDGFALADGRSGAIKIDDGARRARIPVTAAVLGALGVGSIPAELATVPVQGGGQVVGEVRAAAALTA
jgi:L-asparaginase II